MVALGFEVLGHGEGVGIFLTHGGFEIPAAGGLRTKSGHEAGAGGSADGDLTVGALEEGAAGGEGVDMGGEDLFFAVAIELGAEVVDRDEEDVHLLRGKP